MRARYLFFVSLLAILFGPAVVRGQAHFLRGDASDDGIIDISDAIFSLGYQYLGTDAPNCLDAADIDDSGALDISDAVSTLGFLFLGTFTPAAPYPTWEADPTDDDGLGCRVTDDNPMVDVSGDVTSDRTLTAGHVYRLVSGTFIKDGVTLTIEPGVTVIGDSDSDGLLVAERGGKLQAEGTSLRPIVFTSDQPVGSRGRGDWGGVILLGRGRGNPVGGESEAEGLEGQLWGGGANPIDDDTSGTLRFVRVEYGGTEISPDNEVNSISLFGTGSGTVLDHVMCKYNLDDGFEWFGGASTLRYGICVGIRDDNFDYSFGWTGMGQFWLCQQRGDAADRGFEVDNSESEFGARPLTLPTIANVTLIGDPDTNEGDQSGHGITLRRGAGTKLYNAIVTGFKASGIDVDDRETHENQPDGNLIVAHTIFYNNLRPFENDDDSITEGENLWTDTFTEEEFILDLNEGNIVADVSPVVDPYNLDHPNFRPQNDALTDGIDPSSLDSFFQPASYHGAVAPEPTGDWTQNSWISYLQN